MSTIGTAGAIASAEIILAQCERDIKGSAEIIPDGVPESVMPFSWQGNIVRGGTAAKMWRSLGRQTLAMHPEVVREVRMASSSKFPLEMLRTIPYLNPMVVYAEPPELKSWRTEEDQEHWAQYDESTMRLIGFILHGGILGEDRRTHGNQRDAIQAVVDDVTSTHDPAAIALGMVVVFEILDGNGAKLDTEVASFSIPLDGVATLQELVDRQVERFQFSSTRPMTDDRRKWIREVYKVILGTILYLCSTTLDAELVPASATKRLSRTIARKPLSFYRVGWTLGAALTKYRKEQSKGPGSQQGDIAHQQDPQHRKCHFRMQWYGPRTAEACQQMRGTCPCDGRHREWIFIAPYWTHKERLGEVGMNTLRRVPQSA